MLTVQTRGPKSGSLAQLDPWHPPAQLGVVSHGSNLMAGEGETGGSWSLLANQ